MMLKSLLTAVVMASTVLTGMAEAAPEGLSLQVMTSPGCDGGTPPATFVFGKVYDGYLWQSPCEECDSVAKEFAVYGYPTWCWETVEGELAELWLGPLGGGGGDARVLSGLPARS